MISLVFAHTLRYIAIDMPNLSLTRRPPALSRDVWHEKTVYAKEKQNQTENPTHYIHSLIYYL